MSTGLTGLWKSWRTRLIPRRKLVGQLVVVVVVVVLAPGQKLPTCHHGIFHLHIGLCTLGLALAVYTLTHPHVSNTAGNMPITRAHSARREERREKKRFVLIWIQGQVRSGFVCVVRSTRKLTAPMTRFGWYRESKFWGKSGKVVQSWYNERHTGPLDPGLDSEGVQLRFRQHWRMVTGTGLLYCFPRRR